MATTGPPSGADGAAAARRASAPRAGLGSAGSACARSPTGATGARCAAGADRPTGAAAAAGARPRPSASRSGASRRLSGPARTGSARSMSAGAWRGPARGSSPPAGVARGALPLWCAGGQRQSGKEDGEHLQRHLRPGQNARRFRQKDLRAESPEGRVTARRRSPARQISGTVSATRPTASTHGMPLADHSSLPLTERLQPGRSAFDQGCFFEAHELWEPVWRALDGEPRLLVQGLIQVAAGLHHRARGRSRPAARLVTKGLEKVARCAPALRAELDIAPLTAMVVRLMAQAPGDP